MDGSVEHQENPPLHYAGNSMDGTAVRDDGLVDVSAIPLTHALNGGEVTELRKQVSLLQDQLKQQNEQIKSVQAEVLQLKHKLSMNGQRVPSSQSMPVMMELEIPSQSGPLPELATAPPASVPVPGANIPGMMGMEPQLSGANNLQYIHSNGPGPQHDVGRDHFTPNSVQFDGLITLGHAAEHAASDGMQKDSKSLVPRKRAHSTPSLQLDLDEEDVIEELKARNFIVEEPVEDPKTFRGGRPPLGMGPYKRVKEMYDKRMISMDNWRVYYADKCRESGYDGAFRKDLRPRLNHPKATTRKPRQSFPPVYMEPPPLPSTTQYSDSPNVMDLETKILKQLCRELDYPSDIPQEQRFTWNKQLSDVENVEALREYLMTHRPPKMRRGKKPDGITRFPIVFDLWSLSLVESTQFKRIAKYAGVDFNMPSHSINPGLDEGSMLPQAVDQQSDMHMVPPPDIDGMSRMLARGMDGVQPSLDGTELTHGVPQPPLGDEMDSQQHVHSHDAMRVNHEQVVSHAVEHRTAHVVDHTQPVDMKIDVPVGHAVDHSLSHAVEHHPVDHAMALDHVDHAAVMAHEALDHGNHTAVDPVVTSQDVSHLRMELTPSDAEMSMPQNQPQINLAPDGPQMSLAPDVPQITLPPNGPQMNLPDPPGVPVHVPVPTVGSHAVHDVPVSDHGNNPFTGGEMEFRQVGTNISDKHLHR